MSENAVQPIAYLVDDDAAILRLLQTMVTTIGVEARTFVSAQSFLSTYRPGAHECLVCDIRMPGIDGIELQRRLLELDATIPIIFLTGFAEVGIAVEAMKHGAFDFLEKPFSAQSLLSKIKAALASSQQRYAQWFERQAIDARIALLTEREREVIEQVVAGKSSRDISDRLGISVRTVENHRIRIKEKLHVESTVDLVKLFF